MSMLPCCERALSIATFEKALCEAGDTCDLRKLSFIDAYGLVAAACALRSAHEQDELTLLLPSASGIRSHLSSMGFRDFLDGMGLPSGLPGGPAVDASDVVVPLRSTTNSDGAQVLSNLLWEQLQGHVAPQVLIAMAEGVWEMVANALEHSGADALIMGQVYRSARGGVAPHHDDRVQVVIGDSGRGIRQSFIDAGKHSPQTDLEAIHLALEYLVSSVDDPGRGQGLSTTMEQVLDSQGRMVIRSGSGRVSITEAGTTNDEVPLLQGVVVALSLPLYPG